MSFSIASFFLIALLMTRFLLKRSPSRAWIAPCFIASLADLRASFSIAAFTLLSVDCPSVSMTRLMSSASSQLLIGEYSDSLESSMGIERLIGTCIVSSLRPVDIATD